jgi:hypothetical protein
MKNAIKKPHSKRVLKNLGSSDENGSDFDSVRTMRALRDKMSKEIMNMTFEEEKAWLQQLLAKKTA